MGSAFFSDSLLRDLFVGISCALFLAATACFIARNRLLFRAAFLGPPGFSFGLNSSVVLEEDTDGDTSLGLPSGLSDSPP